MIIAFQYEVFDTSDFRRCKALDMTPKSAIASLAPLRFAAA